MYQEHEFKIDLSGDLESAFEAVTGLNLDETSIPLRIRYNTQTNYYEFVEFNGDIIVKNPSLNLLDGFITEDSLDLYDGKKV